MCSMISPRALASSTLRLCPISTCYLQRTLFRSSGHFSVPLSHYLTNKVSHTRVQWKQAGMKGVSAAAEQNHNVTELPNMSVQRVPCLSDNYVWLLHESGMGKTAVVDPSEAAPVIKALDEWGLKADYILNTHHHFDHTGGNLELKQRYGATIVGPAADKDRIPGIDISLKDGDTWKFGQLEMRVFDTPGHTRGHITFYFPGAEALFPGDTLFALGCGRLFEGTPKQMWTSLSKLTPLPHNTWVFCAHEYTQSNAKFAVAIDKDNAKLQERKRLIDEQRSRGMATVPSLLSEELDTNPFLRPHDQAIRAALGVAQDAADVEAFAAIRKAKDNF